MLFSVLFCALVLQVILVSSTFRDAAWADSDVTSNLWGICSRHDTDALIKILSDQTIVPPAAFARSKDGRGPLFWAYEYGFTEGIQILEEIGVSPHEEDAYAKTPIQLGEENAEMNAKRRQSGGKTSGGFSSVGSTEFSDDHYGDEEEDEDYGDDFDDEEEF
mmetsp:Transcript_13441/g.22039  ORF Transcript_13441/g.22039 Transcript_13441/m.22039 type:complete len:162 (-) Transcript_13441:284-769(-)